MVAMGDAVMTREQALEMVKGAETAFGAKDVPTIMEVFTDDIIVRFADQTEVHGKAATSAWLNGRPIRPVPPVIITRMGDLSFRLSSWPLTWP